MSADENKQSAPRQSTDRLEQGAVSDESLSAIHHQLLREKPEPVEGFSPIPIFLLFVFSALVFVSGVYLARYSGEFSPKAFDPSVTAASAEQTAPKKIDPMVLGERLFTQNCVACHQANGMGLPGAFPPLGGSEWVNGSEQRVIRILIHGLTGPVEVAWMTYNGAMPAFGPNSGYRFNAEKIAAVLTYVRASFGNNSGPITEEQVQAVIDATSGRTTSWTAEELKAIE
ncbi:MAG: cytochrome C [Verrucomicrobia bacterium]|nr:MAG: cytochrome C [Verrucomicrobiota bacterium]